MNKRYLCILFLTVPIVLAAQKRYFDPVFSEVNITYDVVYAVNASIFQVDAGPPHAHPESLRMDVYEPQGDTESNRPLVVLLHDGQFLPAIYNGTCKGTKQDGEIVELATRLSKMGYVVAAIDYRLGWNPIAGTELERRFTFINAVHRGVQDSRTCVRFFRKDHAEQNQYRIDPTKITLWGTGTGSYITLASATLDDMADWDKPRFQISNFLPMVQDTFNGNLDGTSVGVVTPFYNQLTGYSIGDTLCSPNHVGYSSDFALAVNLSEGLLDSSWLQADDIPILSFAAPNAPPTLFGSSCEMYCICWFIPPQVWIVLQEIAGSCTIQARQAQLGNNAIWLNANFSDPLSHHSLNINEGREGFYPFWGTDENTPWAFSNPPAPPNLVCDTNALSAKFYLDTILAYFAPRACTVLGLDTNCSPTVANQTTTTPAGLSLEISPNPAVGETLVRSTAPFFSLEIIDLQGKIVQKHIGINTIAFWIQKGDLPNGIYLLRANLEDGFVARKLCWQ